MRLSIEQYLEKVSLDYNTRYNIHRNTVTVHCSYYCSPCIRLLLLYCYCQSIIPVF